jgi:DinB superfamily
MAAERCDECGYDADDWSDSSAIAAIEGLPGCWHEALAGLTSQELHRRPIPSMWSIAEYADHVREVLFGMRFLLDTAVTIPGSDLGESPSTPFDPEPRHIEIKMALAGIEREATALRERLTQLTADQWNVAVRLDGDDVTPHWVARHVVHDATHHLGDVAQPPSDRQCISYLRDSGYQSCFYLLRLGIVGSEQRWTVPLTFLVQGGEAVSVFVDGELWNLSGTGRPAHTPGLWGRSAPMGVWDCFGRFALFTEKTNVSRLGVYAFGAASTP